MLTFGTNTNYATFKEKLTISCVEKYGNLARFLNDGKYYEPDELNPDDFVTAVDAMKEIKRQEMLVEVKERRTAINKMKRERPNMYAYIFSKLSPESEQEVKRHKDYNTFTKSLDPLALWQAIMTKHIMPISTGSKAVLKQSSFHRLCKRKARRI